jgi:hypothetical protein
LFWRRGNEEAGSGEGEEVMKEILETMRGGKE